MSGRSCSHCHEFNDQRSVTWPFCHHWGHRADLPRMDCDCRTCVREAERVNTAPEQTPPGRSLIRLA